MIFLKVKTMTDSASALKLRRCIVSALLLIDVKQYTAQVVVYFKFFVEKRKQGVHQNGKKQHTVSPRRQCDPHRSHIPLHQI